MMNDWVNNGVPSSLKYFLNAVLFDLHFVFTDMPVDIVANARIVVER
jgi:hypothetical protein